MEGPLGAPERIRWWLKLVFAASLTLVACRSGKTAPRSGGRLVSLGSLVGGRRGAGNAAMELEGFWGIFGSVEGNFPILTGSRFAVARIRSAVCQSQIV